MIREQPYKDKQSTPEIFWGEIAPCEHLIQIYEDDGVCLDAVEGFVSGGLRAGDGVVVIATPAHLEALETRLRARGCDLDTACAQDRYITLDAEETLSKFIAGGLPDEDRFVQVVTEIIARAAQGGRRVRAFGEMVAVLWAQGHSGGTVRLEYLWHKLCQQGLFSLFCAYPKSGFTQDADASVREICATHSKMVAG
jgi:hypothetical protein